MRSTCSSQSYYSVDHRYKAKARTERMSSASKGQSFPSKTEPNTTPFEKIVAHNTKGMSSNGALNLGQMTNTQCRIVDSHNIEIQWSGCSVMRQVVIFYSHDVDMIKWAMKLEMLPLSHHCYVS